MTGLEIAYAVGALAAIVIVLALFRRAAAKQLRDAPKRREVEEPAAAPRVKGRPERKQLPEAEVDDEDEGDDEAAAEAEPDEEAAEAPDAAAAEAEEGRKALRKGLEKTRGGFVSRLGKLFAKKQIDDDVLDELEEVLLTADIGPRTADKLFQAIKSKLSKKELDDSAAIWAELRRQCADILSVGAGPVDIDSAKPFVLLTIGVNGVGKTTTIGKLAAMHAERGKKVMLAAGDTFRAAAVEQLEIWGKRADAPVVRGKDGADPSSVIFDGIKRAEDEEYDLLIADTAGRLHTKVDLMEELKKVRRVCDKAMSGAPHETWLVVDATTGQNAISQAQMFKEAMDITGIVLTKLDGTAKGGVILGICDELGVPVRYVGVGEQVKDLRPFDPDAFIDALFASEDAHASETAA